MVSSFGLTGLDPSATRMPCEVGLATPSPPAAAGTVSYVTVFGEVTTGTDAATFPLADCSGNALPAGVDQLSILARPSSAPKPNDKITATGRATGPNVAPGIRRIDPRAVDYGKFRIVTKRGTDRGLMTIDQVEAWLER